jgi:hypothetical protein
MATTIALVAFYLVLDVGFFLAAAGVDGYPWAVSLAHHPTKAAAALLGARRPRRGAAPEVTAVAI